ncbi:biotin--protein ligase-like [Micropterus dolomieu]|uniref:biotin--protein ligase-like n=1 Tax=Micropterus dolomieu TaxID=147949 RepID=UPI001E8E65C9|nr:biotin--protein ligase-like [Micropterus dolomieu]
MVHFYTAIFESVLISSITICCKRQWDATTAPHRPHWQAGKNPSSQEAKASFLKWLQTRADQNGLLTLSKTSLRIVSCSELQDGPLLPQGSQALVTNSSESQSWAQFSMETYSKNLKTSLLGRTLLYAEEAKASFLKWLQTRADQNGLLTLSKTSLRIVSCSELQDGPLLPQGSQALVTNSSESQSWAQFSMETYSKNLKTSLLGRTLLYAEVVTSTMDLLEGLTLHLPKDVSLIAVAAQQNQGRGRGRNAWLSPQGCAMFTLGVQVELSSRLGQRIPFLQHLVALAVVEAVRTLPGYQDIDLRVKWPNDIYYSNLMKLGGVLVTSTVIGSTFHLLIGCGFNVTNSNPTVCINDLIQQYNIQHNCSLQPLSCAQLIARTVSCLEALISSFQQGGPDAVLPIYYKRWLHSGTQVRLWSEDGLEAEVVGLDCNGFLQVHSKEQGVVSVEPDGNSFDMLRNLVVIKQR